MCVSLGYWCWRTNVKGSDAPFCSQVIADEESIMTTEWYLLFDVRKGIWSIKYLHQRPLRTTSCQLTRLVCDTQKPGSAFCNVSHHITHLKDWYTCIWGCRSTRTLTKSYHANSYPSQLVPNTNLYPDQLVPTTYSYPNHLVPNTNSYPS